jgi:hypothetical protein
MPSAGGTVTGSRSTLGEQNGKVREGLGAPRGQARGRSAVEVVEDLADEIRIDDVCDDPQLPAAERAEADVNVEDAP